MRKYDVIGDIHGCATTLEKLLVKLGYQKINGVYQLEGHQVICVGDLIDRGDEQVAVLDIVKPMVENKKALMVLGNHEFNAIAWATPNPELPGEYLRPRNEKNRKQHKNFLDQIQTEPGRYAETIEWFQSLPMWLELAEGIRIVHACWNDQAIETIKGYQKDDENLTNEFMVLATQKHHPLNEAIEIVLKGPELKLADYGEKPFRDPEGNERARARIRWWDKKGTTLRDLAEIPSRSTRFSGKPYRTLPKKPVKKEVLAWRYTSDQLVFFGHYWQTGVPDVASTHAVCVDYSAVKKGGLAAYRWSGEKKGTKQNFVHQRTI